GLWRRSLDEDRGIPAENPLLRSFGKRERPQPFDLLAYARNSRRRPVRPEDDLVRDFFESREPFQQSLRRDARDLQVEVPMASKQVERSVAPERSPAMSHWNREIGEILCDIVEGHRVPEFRSRAGKDRGPSV